MIVLHGRHGFPQSTIRSDDDAIVFMGSQEADAV